MFKCTNYYTLKIDSILHQDINKYLQNKSAIYLFKYDYRTVIDYATNDTVYDGLEKLITKRYHEIRSDTIGLFFNTSISLTSKMFSDTKKDLLIDIIKNDEPYRYKNIKNLLNIITENQHPLYIGKANKLASRIKQHILGGKQSHLKDNLSKYDINIEECILSYHYIDDNLDENTNELFEDVITRVLKPGFVRRIG